MRSTETAAAVAGWLTRASGSMLGNSERLLTRAPHFERALPLSREERERGNKSGSGLGLSDERGLESNLRGFGRVDRREPAGIRHERGRESVAAVLHFRPGAFLAIFDSFIGDDRQRKRDPLGHV